MKFKSCSIIMNNLKLPSSILICGKPKTGKTHAIKYLMYKFTAKRDIYSRFSYGVVFCRTSFNNSYSYIPEKWIFSEYKPEVLKNLMNIQKSIRAQGYVPPHAFVIFDDCLGSVQFKSDLFKDAVQNYRHYNISLIISSQYVARIETVNRECASNAIIFRQYSKNVFDAIYNSFGQRFDSEKEFKDYLNKNTGDYNFIFVDNECLSDNLNDAYQVMKCPPTIPDPKINFITSVSPSKLKQDK